MGKRSFEEIGRPLPNRKTILISTTLSCEEENCTTVGSLKEALALVGDRDALVAGGEQLYKEALPLVDRMYITQVDCTVEGDTFFPDFAKEDFRLLDNEVYEGEPAYTYLTYERIYC